MKWQQQAGINIIIIIMLASIGNTAYATDLRDLTRLKQAYPEHIQSVSQHTLIWLDGTRMLIGDGITNKTTQEKLDSPSLLDQMSDVHYRAGIPVNIVTFNPTDDPGRIRYEPFFRQLYGNSKREVAANLTTIFWMPKFFGHQYPLLVTTVNNVDRKFVNISHELEMLVAQHPEYLPYLKNPGGTFKWRYIANTHRLSPHSFGMTIDINANHANYWQWHLRKQHLPVTENAQLTYHNNIPWEIICIFEKYGFIWGGKWHHYDTMHFEYRPELLIK